MKLENLSLNYRLAIALGVALFLWMLTGLVQKQENADEASNSDGNNLKHFTVRASTSQSETFQRTVFIRGLSEVNREVDVVAQADGVVVKTPATEGSLVRNGDSLCELGAEDRPLKLAQAIAQRDKAEIDYNGALKLKDGAYQSRTQIAAAKENLALAEANLEAMEILNRHLVVRAPFTGILHERYVEAGAFMQRGTPCAKLIELSPLIVVGYVAEHELSSLQLGSLAKVIFLDGVEREGQVTYIAQTSQENTRTFRVEVELPNSDMSLSGGKSASLVVYSESMPAHRISPSLFILLDEGKVGLKILDKNNRVVINEIQFLGDSDTGAWVSGLAPTVRYISVGQQYVDVGDLVNVVEENKKHHSQDKTPTPDTEGGQ